ncbi:hypothetical protein [Paraburkholderia sp. J8-2]|uniref:hypothetical protein n=1 Tax=Paraburkholderia sp. J8-2 TaxID=2805440 RepID=UPI002AB78DBB|nr:hypothetical protein [Paraburkholderia sp. J8-2]
MNQEFSAECESELADEASAIDTPTAERTNRLRGDLCWLAGLLARSMHSIALNLPERVFELKGSERVHAEAIFEIDIRVYGRWARRWVSRDYYFLQEQVTLRKQTRRDRDMLAEFEARVAEAVTAYPIDEKLLALLPYHKATVRITSPIAARVLEQLCEVDRALACHYFGQSARGIDGPHGICADMIREALHWLKGNPHAPIESRNGVRVASRYISTR